MGVVPDGGEQLAALSRALKRAGEVELGKQLDEGFRRPLLDLIPALEASQQHVMPKRGGMARVARERTTFGVRKVVAGRYPGMRLQGKQRGRIARQDRGVLRHPVFADQSKPRDQWRWVDQRIEAGWFSDVTKAAQPSIRRSTEQALEAVVRQIEVDYERRR